MTITTAEIERAFPEYQRSTVTPKFIGMVNQISGDPNIGSLIRGNFIRYAIVLREGRFKPEDYLTAVAYITYKAMGCSNQDAYARTFPQRHRALVTRGASSKNVSSAVAMYNKTKLVTLLTEKAMIAVWLLNHDTVQMAIKIQLNLMLCAKSEMVRMHAANSILTHLRPPERRTKVDLSISASAPSGLDELRVALNQLAMRKHALIE